MGCSGKKLCGAVIADLPDTMPGKSYEEIASSLREWRPFSVKSAVRDLVEEGAVVRGGTHINPRFWRAHNTLAP